MDVQWLPSPNFGERPAGRGVDGVIVHATAGRSESADVVWCRTPKHQLPRGYSPVSYLPEPSAARMPRTPVNADAHSGWRIPLLAVAALPVVSAARLTEGARALVKQFVIGVVLADNEIRRPIVGRIAIDVVYLRSGWQVFAERLFSYKDVLVNVALRLVGARVAGSKYPHVSARQLGPSTLPSGRLAWSASADVVPRQVGHRLPAHIPTFRFVAGCEACFLPTPAQAQPVRVRSIRRVSWVELATMSREIADRLPLNESASVAGLRCQRRREAAPALAGSARVGRREGGAWTGTVRSMTDEVRHRFALDVTEAHPVPGCGFGPLAAPALAKTRRYFAHRTPPKRRVAAPFHTPLHRGGSRIGLPA